MKIRKFKLQNLILSCSSLHEENTDMMYRGARYTYDKVKSYYRWEPGNFAEFFTYFNTFALNKWTKYTHVDNVYLQLRCKGKFKIALFAHYRVGSEISKEMYDVLKFDLPEMTDIRIPVPMNSNGEVVGFQFEALEPEKSDDEEIIKIEEKLELIKANKKRSALKNKSNKNANEEDENFDELIEELEEKLSEWREQSGLCIESGGWYTDIDESLLNEVNIAIASTTFKNEKYIKRNMDLLEKKIFYSGEDVSEHIRLVVIDNGRTLDPEEHNSEYITVIPNENVGGAGGFTRGMLESIDLKGFDTTHVLLMDDDVTMMPESFIRTYSFLSLLKDEYKERFLSGAMLYFEHMNIQHEDVGFIHEDGSYGPNKKVMDMHLWSNVFENEEDIKFHENSYAGWWYCCIPVSKIKMDHLPVPLFIRGDDVEFSISSKAEFLTLGGICVWHKGFANKFNANLELYLVHRNSLIIQAMCGVAEDIDFAERIDKFFVSNICRYAYNNCELLLDAIEEYCKGPEFMFTPQGERIMKEHAKKNEVLKPIHQVYNKTIDFDSVYDKKKEYEILEEEEIIKIGNIRKKKKRKKNEEKTEEIIPKLNNKEYAYYLKTYNGQTLSDKQFEKKMNRDIAIIAYDWYDAPEKQYMAKEILAVNPAEKTAVIRKRDTKRFNELMERRKRVLSYYNQNKKSIAAMYKDAASKLLSDGFWREYLNMDK